MRHGHCLSFEFLLPFLAKTVPFLVVPQTVEVVSQLAGMTGVPPLPFHCLYLIYHCPSLTFHCLFTASP